MNLLYVRCAHYLVIHVHDLVNVCSLTCHRVGHDLVIVVHDLVIRVHDLVIPVHDLVTGMGNLVFLYLKYIKVRYLETLL